MQLEGLRWMCLGLLFPYIHTLLVSNTINKGVVFKKKNHNQFKGPLSTQSGYFFNQNISCVKMMIQYTTFTWHIPSQRCLYKREQGCWMDQTDQTEE